MKTFFVFSLLFVGGWELFWRFKGFVPNVTDDLGVWTLVRRSASLKGGKPVVIVGASRIQVGFHPDVFAALTGIHPAVLAIDGSSPISVLEDLISDPTFKGNVICSLSPHCLVDGLESAEKSDKWVKKYRKQSRSFLVWTHLFAFFQGLFVFLYKNLTPVKIWSHLMERKWPHLPYIIMRSDRFRLADYSKVDLTKLRAAREKRERQIHSEVRPLTKKQFFERIKRIDKMAEQLENKDGQLVFIRFPSTGIIRKLEQETWPKKTFWDVFADGTRAITIHFEDYPSLSGFHCPDGSHLDIKDAARFTRELVTIFSEKGFEPWKN